MIGYLDLASGLSGDMFLGCLVDAGYPLASLRETIAALRLPAGSWSIEAKSVMRGALRATLVDVKVNQQAHHHHHDDPHHHHHHEPHRNLHDIRVIIEGSALPEAVKRGALGVFERLAVAEAKVHGTTVDKIHFHEVGALDAIIDIVGAAAGLQYLNIETLYAAAAPLGGGWIQSAHGKIPLPAPATVELLAAAGAPMRPAPGDGELVTPTGAAILAQFATFAQPAMRLHKVGLGAGQREFDWPNVTRLMLGESEAMADAAGGDRGGEASGASGGSGGIVQIETNLDDMNPQLVSAVTQKLLAAGARDAWLTAVHMKKGRPGVVLSVLAEARLEAGLCEIILRETTTLGVRVHAVTRREARRELRSIDTEFGPVRVKLKWWGEELLGATPEYEDCARLAESRGLPVKMIHDSAAAAAHRLLEKEPTP